MHFSRCFGVYFHDWGYLLTHAGAAFPICTQCPALVTGALDQVFVLLTHLRASLVGGTVVHDFTRFIVFLELVSFWAGADNSSSRNNRTVVTAASIVERTLICEGADGLSHIVFFSLPCTYWLNSLTLELESGILYPLQDNLPQPFCYKYCYKWSNARIYFSMIRTRNASFYFY